MAKRPQQSQDGHRINDRIRAREVLIITDDGDKKGPLAIEDALRLAYDQKMDLVEVSPNVDPPVCKIMNYGKYKYQQNKRKQEAKKKQKAAELKEIKMRPNIDQHDYQTKINHMKKFFEKGDKVKVSLRFKGREMAHQHLGMELMQRVKEEFAETTKVEQEPKMDGRQVMMVLMPIKA